MTGLSTRPIPRIVRAILMSVFPLISVVVIVLAVTPQGRAATKTAIFLPQILPDLPIRPQELLTRSPTREGVFYPNGNGVGSADLYVPGRGSGHGALLLFLGVNPAGRDDPRVVGLAEGLARSGVVVMIPWSDTMTQRRIAPEEVENLVNAFRYLRDLDVTDPNRVGMGGFCVGASLATVAAQDLRINEHVRFVNFFGGYYNATDLLRSVVTQRRYYDGSQEFWSPNSLSIEVVSTHLIEGLENPTERDQLTRTFLRRESIPPSELNSLSDEANAVAALLSGPSLDEVDGLLERLPDSTIESLDFISPSTNLSRLNARMLIMHDREDTLVPSEESRRLVDALGEGRDTYYTEFSLFQHVDPTKVVSPPEFAREAFKLFLHTYNIMREIS